MRDLPSLVGQINEKIVYSYKYTSFLTVCLNKSQHLLSILSVVAESFCVSLLENTVFTNILYLTPKVTIPSCV